MTTNNDILIFSVFFLLFAFLHSLTAANWFKEHVRRVMGRYYSFYRIFYNLLSVITWVFFMHILSPPISGEVYQVKGMVSHAFRFIQLFAVLMLGVTFLQFDTLAFIGVRQVMEFFTAEGDYDKLTTGGVFALVRHPVYLFASIFLWFTPHMSLQRLLINIWITLYFIAGMFLEEKRLEKQYSRDYIEYKRHVPRIIPLKLVARRFR